MILYYAPTACSIAPHIALEEIGVPFEARRIDLGKGEQTSEAFLKISPLGRVPALIVDGAPVTELPALLTYIASLKPDAALVPPPGTLAYARCFEWLGFLASSLHVAYAQFRRPIRFVAEGSPAWDEVSDAGRRNTIAAYREVERRLRARPEGAWAAGDAYSIADINLFAFPGWAWRFDFDLAVECPRWTALVQRMKERPAVQRAMAREAAET